MVDGITQDYTYTTMLHLLLQTLSLNIALTLSIEIKNSSVPHKSTGCPKKKGD